MTSTPLPPRPSRWRELLKAAGVVVGILMATVASGILLLMWSCTPPSLETLQHRFPKQRKDLETILAMSNQDKQLLRIDPDWLLNDKFAQFVQYDPAAGITVERWNEYRRLFSRNGITQGIQRELNSDDAFIMVKSEGLLNRGISNGYLYCGARPAHRYVPCTLSSQGGSHEFEGHGDEGYSFIKLDGGWYAFSHGPS
jgi:hypothetical protein